MCIMKVECPVGAVIQTNCYLGYQLATGRWPFKRGTEGYKLHQGHGVRSISQHVAFPRHFAAETSPSVITFFSGLDVLAGADLTVATDPVFEMISGFHLNLHTKQKTRVWSASCSWLAVGKPGTKPCTDFC